MGAVAIVAVALILLRVAGMFTIALVATPSMSPHLPPGSLFLALPFEPDQGDVVVFDAPGGDRVVHRVVAVTPEGLITKGDANTRTDQDLGWPAVDPENVHVVPHIGATPLALSTPAAGTAWVVAIQACALGAIVYLLARRTQESTPRSRIRPSHVVLAGAALLIAVIPLLTWDVAAGEEVVVQGPILPSTVRVEATATGSQAWDLVPSETLATGMAGPATVQLSPAYPGSRHIAQWNQDAVFLPPCLALIGAGLYIRQRGH